MPTVTGRGAGEAPVAILPLPGRLGYLADYADAIEGRTPPESIPVDVWTEAIIAGESDAMVAAWRRTARLRAEDADLAARLGIAATDVPAARAEALGRWRAGEAAAVRSAALWGDLDRLDPAVLARNRAAATSLDTGQQLDIGKTVDTSAPARDSSSESPGARARDRVERYDRAKAGLAAAVREAAGERWGVDDVAGGAWLDRTAGRVDGCRQVRAFRDVCGAWIARPESCHVRTCPDCERARSGRLVRRLDGVAADMRSPRFWTVTIPNVAGDRLGFGLDVLLESFAALRRLAIFRGGPCKGVHADPADKNAPPARCRHAPHRRDRARLGRCNCARCQVTDTRGLPGIDAGPCVHRGARDLPRCGITAADHDGLKHRYRPGRRRRGCRRCSHAPVRGGVYAVEVTYNAERDEWHPHVHALIDAPYIVWAEFQAAWRAVTCDTTRRLEARGHVSTRATGWRTPDGPRDRVRLPRCEHRADAKGRPLDGCRGASVVWVEDVTGAPGSPERRGAIRETVKYVTKGVVGKDGALNPALTPTRLADLLLALRGRRLVAGWGTLRHVHDADDGEPDALGERIAWPSPFAGLPVTCPNCRQTAEWTSPVAAWRVDCVPIPDAGAMRWKPPPPGRAPP